MSAPTSNRKAKGCLQKCNAGTPGSGWASGKCPMASQPGQSCRDFLGLRLEEPRLWTIARVSRTP